MFAPQELYKAMAGIRRDAFVAVVIGAALADMVAEIRAGLAPLDWSEDVERAIGHLGTLLGLSSQAHGWLWVWATDTATLLSANSTGST